MLRFPIAILVLCGSTFGANVNQHVPIVIQSDQDFVSCSCVVSGSGSTADPYVIGPWAINKADGVGVTVDGSNLTRSFVLWNLTIGGNGSSSATGVLLKNVNRIGAAVEGSQTLIQSWAQEF